MGKATLYESIIEENKRGEEMDGRARLIWDEEEEEEEQKQEQRWRTVDKYGTRGRGRRVSIIIIALWLCYALWSIYSGSLPRFI